MAIVLGVVGILLFQGAFQNDLIREQTQRIPTGDGVPAPGAPEANPAATAPTEGSSGE
jgi:hypothetical protein